ncbi:MAG TPA: hypothetical protein GXX21_06440 [Syntrophomonadaceae bacterium]|nr:hypothetical protein [Syntrophomonadaceae bacterium]
MDEALGILISILTGNEENYKNAKVKSESNLSDEQEKFALVKELFITEDLVNDFKFLSTCSGYVLKQLKSEVLYQEIGTKELLRYAKIKIEFESNDSYSKTKSIVFETNEHMLTNLINQLTRIRNTLRERVSLDGYKISQ